MSQYPHRIRLHGPWQCEPLARLAPRPAELPPPRRLRMPCRWKDGDLAGFAGRVCFRRHFGYPGQIDADERIWLTIDAVPESIRLNRQELEPTDRCPSSIGIDVTRQLAARNDLELVYASSENDPGDWGEVALEIRRTAYLRSVEVTLTGENDPAGPRLHARGEVVGSAESSLELYVLLDNRTVAYAVAEPAAAGSQFYLAESVETERLTPGVHTARVELVDGASVWYAVNCQLKI